MITVLFWIHRSLGTRSSFLKNNMNWKGIFFLIFSERSGCRWSDDCVLTDKHRRLLLQEVRRSCAVFVVFLLCGVFSAFGVARCSCGLLATHCCLIMLPAVSTCRSVSSSSSSSPSAEQNPESLLSWSSLGCDVTAAAVLWVGESEGRWASDELAKCERSLRLRRWSWSNDSHVNCLSVSLL